MTKDKERDDALTAENLLKARIDRAVELAGDGADIYGQMSQFNRLVKEGWQPKPDRAEVLAEELWPYLRSLSRDRLVPILNRHFDELRAEIEAERPAVVVPREAKLWADSVGYCSATRYEERTTAKWIKSLDGAKGPAVVVPSEDQIKQMTNRFLGWRLPEDFRPDDGISFEPEFNKEWNASQGKPPQRRTPTGTNLFNATQAEAMVRYMLGDDT